MAEVQIRRWTGSTPTKTNITLGNSRMSASDEAIPSSSNAILTPSSGSNYSYWVTTRLFANTAPTGTIDNIRWYTDGVKGWDSELLFWVQQATSYVQATGTLASTGIQLTTGNHAGLTGAPVNAFTYTAVSPLAVTGSTTGTGDFGNFVVFQLEVQSGAIAQTTTQETMFWRYDET